MMASMVITMWFYSTSRAPSQTRLKSEIGNPQSTLDLLFITPRLQQAKMVLNRNSLAHVLRPALDAIKASFNCVWDETGL